MRSLVKFSNKRISLHKYLMGIKTVELHYRSPSSPSFCAPPAVVVAIGFNVKCYQSLARCYTLSEIEYTCECNNVYTESRLMMM